MLSSNEVLLSDEQIESLTGEDLDIAVQSFVFHQEIRFRTRADGQGVYAVSIGSMLDEYPIPAYHGEAFATLFNLLTCRHGKPFSIFITAFRDVPLVSCVIQFRDDWRVKAEAESPSVALARAALKAEARLRETSGAITLKSPTQHDEQNEVKHEHQSQESVHLVPNQVH